MLRPAAVAAKKPESKFKPRAIKKVNHNVPVVDGVVPKGASILIIQEPWVSLILDGHKSFEIRGRICNKPRGEKIYIALSGGGGIVVGAATFVACHGPLSKAEYAAAGERHCVAGEALPYGGSTYAWELTKPVRFRTPIPYNHKRGVVVWAKME